MPNLSDRQHKLLSLLNSRFNMSTDEIKRSFSISAATASRDIRALVLSGEAVDTGHGIQLASPKTQEKNCFYCGGLLNDRTVFIIQMEDGIHREACCPHCGLMAIDEPGTQNALAKDFLYGRMVNASQAIYLLGSSVNCCCVPSVLSFDSQGDALSFQKGFGGRVFSFESVIDEIKALMKL